MRRRIIDSRIDDDGLPTKDKFYEAMPAAAERRIYRDDPVVVERHNYDRTGLSGWAVLGVIVLALIVLLLLLGRFAGMGTGVNRTINLPNATTQPTTPTGR